MVVERPDLHCGDDLVRVSRSFHFVPFHPLGARPFAHVLPVGHGCDERLLSVLRSGQIFPFGTTLEMPTNHS